MRDSYDNRFNLIYEYKMAIKEPMSVQQIKLMSNDRLWGLWMDSLAWFKLKHKYFSLDDVPEELKVYGQTIDIRTPGKLTTYAWDGYKWDNAGSIHDEFYKG